MKKNKPTMEQSIEKLRAEWSAGDAVRDAGLTVPETLCCLTDIPYGGHPLQKLDVYWPGGAQGALPTIISIHGGGWFYGSKELYSHYCMRLAERGFAVVNFSYRLAPEDQYPAALQDICAVLFNVRENAAAYHIDLDNVFMLGDSAGGQLCWQICAMLTNPAYAALFDFAVPQDFKVNACALNCGCYFIPVSRLLPPQRMGAIFEAYLPADYLPAARQLRVQKYITNDFPPAFVMSAQNDYLKFMAAPAYRILKKKGVEAELHIYGTKEQKEIGHVFHVNCRLPLADVCNDEECAFFRRHLKKAD